jgi:hypothetical protein
MVDERILEAAECVERAHLLLSRVLRDHAMQVKTVPAEDLPVKEEIDKTELPR